MCMYIMVCQAVCLHVCLSCLFLHVFYLNGADGEDFAMPACVADRIAECGRHTDGRLCHS